MVKLKNEFVFEIQKPYTLIGCEIQVKNTWKNVTFLEVFVSHYMNA